MYERGRLVLNDFELWLLGRKPGVRGGEEVEMEVAACSYIFDFIKHLIKNEE